MVIIRKRSRLVLKNLADKLKNKFTLCQDFKFYSLGKGSDIYVCYFNGLVDMRSLNQDVIKPIVESNIKEANKLAMFIKEGNIYNIDLKQVVDIDEIAQELFSGNTAIVLGSTAYIFETKGFEKRSVEEATGEKTSKGSRDSFIEVLSTNISMIRRRTKTEKLKTEIIEVGTLTKTNIGITYIEDTVDKKILQNIKNKINNFNIPAITSLSDFEENIVDDKYSMYPQFVYTERPDKFCSNILEGKVGIIIDGYATAYVLPGVFAMFMQSTEEYSSNYIISSIIRFLRYVSLLVSLLVPALYVAVTTFHQEMIPTKLAQAIINSKQDVPFPAFIEIIIMLVAFEMLLEAGARMPENVGQTVSIMGGLIIGEAAVNAKFVSPAVVVVVAAAGVSGFLIPNQDLANATRINRMILVLAASIAGLFGISMAIIGIIYYLANLDSFGVPYLKPFVANKNKDILADTIVRGLNKKDKNKMARW